MLPEFDRVDGAQSQRAVYPATSNSVFWWEIR